MGLALFTLIAFGGAGAWLIAEVQGRSLRTMFFGSASVLQHMLLGVATGLLIAAGAWWIIRQGFMAPVRDRYAALIGPLLPGRLAQVLVSVCAGVGEELFFRGALQHWLGIPITAILFVALHGYLDPRDRRVSIYGAFLTVAMIGLGYMVAQVGLLGAMVAHTIIDVVLLDRLVAVWRREHAA